TKHDQHDRRREQQPTAERAPPEHDSEHGGVREQMARLDEEPGDVGVQLAVQRPQPLAPAIGISPITYFMGNGPAKPLDATKSLPSIVRVRDPSAAAGDTVCSPLALCVSPALGMS